MHGGRGCCCSKMPSIRHVRMVARSSGATAVRCKGWVGCCRTCIAHVSCLAQLVTAANDVRLVSFVVSYDPQTHPRLVNSFACLPCRFCQPQLGSLRSFLFSAICHHGQKLAAAPFVLRWPSRPPGTFHLVFLGSMLSQGLLLLSAVAVVPVPAPSPS